MSVKKNQKWINTRTVWEWKDGRLIEVENQGFFYDGPVALAMTDFNIDQDSYAFFADDGGEHAATQVGTTNNQTSLDVDTTYWCRVLLQEYNGGAGNNQLFNWQYQNVTKSTGWVDITTTSSHVKAVTSSNLTDNGDTTTGANSLSAGTFITDNDGVTMDGDGGGTADFVGNDETESILVFQIVSADVDNSDVIELRCQVTGAVTQTYTNTPSISVNESVNNDIAATLSTVVTTTPGIKGAGSLAANPTAVLSTTAGLNGVGALSASHQLAATVLSDIKALGSLVVAISASLSLTPSLKALGSLASSIVSALTTTAAVGSGAASSVNQLLFMPTPEDAKGWEDARATTDLYVEDHEGLLRAIPPGELPFEKSRCVRNLWPTSDNSQTPTTQVITVVANQVYQLRIGATSASGATAVCSGAFSGTLTGNATNPQSFDTAKTATTTSLTITITGSVKDIQLENVTGQTNQNTSEYVSVNVGDGTELVTNGAFDTDTDWIKGTGWTISGGEARGTYSNGLLVESTPSVAAGVSGKYLVEVDVTIYGGTRTRMLFRNANDTTYVTTNYLNGTGHKRVLLNLTDGLLIRFSPDTTNDIGLDNVTCQRIENQNALKQYSTANGNTVASNVVTEDTGADLSPVPYLRHVPSETNLCTYARDFTNAAWSKTNITIPTENVTAVDGTVVADKLTLLAGAANSTILFTHTAASADFISGFYLKRKTGTGNVDITVDGGTTWETKTLTSAWQWFDVTKQTVANPQLGIRIATSGDAIYADFAMLKAGTFIGSPIPTSGSTASRNATAFQTPLNTGAGGNLNQTEGALSLRFTPEYDLNNNSTSAMFLASNSSASGASFVYTNSGGALRAYDGTQLAGTSSFIHDAGDEVEVGLRWESTTNKMQIGYKNITDAASWVWYAEATYDGAWPIGLNIFGLMYNNTNGIININDLVLQDAVATTAEIEAGLPSGASASNDIAAALLAVLSVSPDMSASGSLSASIQATLSALANLDAQGLLSSTQSVALTVAANLNALGEADVALAVALSIVSDLDAAGSIACASSTALNVAADVSNFGSNDISATLSAVLSVVAGLSATGNTNAALSILTTVSPTLSSTGDMQAALLTSINVLADMDATGQLSASQSILFSLTPDLNAVGEINAALFLALAVAADIQAGADNNISASIVSAFNVAGDLDAQGALNTTISLITSINADVVDSDISLTPGEIEAIADAYYKKYGGIIRSVITHY